jgi:two-component system, OmpR family, alkaline phosphatase synthesis response regulator PhoP
MAKARILVVEDEEDLSELLRFHLAKEGYHPQCVASGEEAVKVARALAPDLVLLDLMLPAMDGLQVCKLLKGDPRTQHAPVIMLTAKAEESDIVTGLEVGADDYIAKPFSPKVVIARIRNALRRRARDADESAAPIKVRDLVIHPGRHEVTIKGKLVDLTFTEFKILQFLASRPGWVFSRAQIVDAVRGEDYAVTDRAVDVQIVGLRRKLGAQGSRIETVRGVGYRFSDE